LGRNRPAADGPKPLGQGDGFAAKLSAPGPRIPLHNDRLAIAAKKLVSPGLATGQPPEELERLPRDMSEQ